MRRILRICPCCYLGTDRAAPESERPNGIGPAKESRDSNGQAIPHLRAARVLRLQRLRKANALKDRTAPTHRRE